MASLKRRGRKYYAQYYVAGKQKRVALDTDSYQIAKDKVRQIESAFLRGSDIPLPTKTPLAEIVAAYVEHISTTKSPRGVRADVYYLRDTFGPICPQITVTSQRTTVKARKRPAKPRRRTTEKAKKAKKRPVKARRRTVPHIEAGCIEELTTAQISAFITATVRTRGLAPKTANRYREILSRLINWATKQRGVRMPNSANPAAQVERYKEKAPRIRFLTLKQIDEQLNALEGHPQLQTMVAMYIFAGLRREEALWLTTADVDLKAAPYGVIRIQAKTIEGAIWQPKTAVNRAVPISRALRSHLDRYMPRITLVRWYFPSPEGKRYDPDNFSRDLRAEQKDAGLSWTCLDYRHTFGSQLAMKGESLYKIATLLGNSPEICRRHYAALLPEALTGTVEFAPLQVSGKSA